MSVREYVGARYVPIFVGEWDNNRTYEPLMVVSYQGASYTSRQYVPADIEITNESYWVLSANYNAQVEAYRKELHEILPYDEAPTEGSTKGVTSDGIKKAIANEVTRAKEAEQANADAIANEVTRAKEAEQANADAIADAIANEVTRAKEAEQANADAIAIETANREADDKAIKSDISTLQLKTTASNRKFLWIGDSFSSEAHVNTGGNWSPVSTLRGLYHLDIENVAKDGAGFIGISGVPTFLQQAQGHALNGRQYTDIVVYGGNNDTFGLNASKFTKADLGNSVQAFWNYCSSEFPNARFWLFCNNTPNINSEICLYVYIYRTQVTTNRCAIFSDANAVQLSINSYQLGSKNFHPTYAFSNYMADWMYKCLNGGESTFSIYTKISSAISTAHFVDGFGITADNNGFTIPELRIDFDNGASLSNGAVLAHIPFWVPNENGTGFGTSTVWSSPFVKPGLTVKSSDILQLKLISTAGVDWQNVSGYNYTYDLIYYGAGFTVSGNDFFIEFPYSKRYTWRNVR